MSARMEDLPRLRRRFPRRRLFVYSALGSIAIVIVAALIAVLYIRSERFNRFLAIEIDKALEACELRAETERVEPDFGSGAVTLRNLKLFNRRTGQIIATIGRASASLKIRDPFALRLRREIVFERLELDGVDLWVVIDEEGRSNFQGLRRPPPLRRRITFDYSKLAGSLRGGAIHFVDRKRDLQGDLRELAGEGRPISGADPPSVGLRLTAGSGSIGRHDHKIAIESIEFIGQAANSGVVVERLALQSPVGAVTASGQLDDWRSPRYRLDMRAWAWIDEILALFAPVGASTEPSLKGAASFSGRIEGEGARWIAGGQAGSGVLTAYGVTYRDTQADGARIESRDGQWTFSIGLARALSVAASGVEFTTASASNVRGTIVKGQTRITADQASVAVMKIGETGANEFSGITLLNVGAIYESGDGEARWTFSGQTVRARSAVAGGAELTNVSASNVEGTVAGGRAKITSSQATFEHAEAGQGVFNGIALRDIAATLGSGANGVGGFISLRDGNWGKIEFGQSAAAFALNRDKISLNGFSASLLGGGATGDLTVALDPNADSKLSADVAGMRTAEFFALFGARSDQIAGSVTGRASLTWPGMKLRSISGEISARFDGQTISTPDAIPVKGEILARARNGVFSFDRFELWTDASALAAAGRLALDGDSDMRFSLTSTRAEELLTILGSRGLAGSEVERLMKTYEPHLFGDFSFTGTLNGKLGDPVIAGDLQASSFGLRDEILGGVRGRALISTSEIRFENGSLSAGSGGSARFNYVAPRAATASTGKLDITFERINLDSLLASIGAPTRQTLMSGEVSGSAHLTGLPAATQGEVNLSLSDGFIAGQRAESVTASIKFDPRTARIERVEARLPQGYFTAGGVINLQTNEYQFQGEARQLGLQRLAEAFELGAVQLGGSADVTFQLSGDFDNSESFKIDMTAESRRFRFNGREYGPGALTARTSADGRIDIQIWAEIAGRRQAVVASLELRRPGRPITITADLADFDIAPFLSAYAPDVTRYVSGRVTGKLRVAGPMAPDQGGATPAGLRGALTLTDVALQVAGTPVVVSTPLDITIGDAQIRVASTRITGRGADIVFGGSIALTENAPIDFSIAGKVSPGAYRRPDDSFNLDGEIAIDARVSGSINNPNVAGAATLRDISVSMPDALMEFEGGSGRVVLSGDRLTVENFTARAGGGSAQISGGATLERFRFTEWRFDITANDAKATWRGVQAAIDANLTLTGTPQGQTLSGRVAIPAAEYASSELSLVEIGERGRLSFGAFGAGGNGARGSAIPPIDLDVTVEARESFIIRSNQVNTTASATIRLTGSLADPELSGRVTLEGGAVIFRGHRYDIISGWMELPGGYEEPRLRLQAEGNIRGYRIIISFNGPINGLDLSLHSEPPLSRPEILSLITAGGVGSGAINAPDPARAELTTAGALLSDEFISKTIGRETERFLGLNRFQIDPALRPYDNPAARITVGRQLARGFSFFYSTNLASEQEQTGVLEYDITKQFSVVTTYTQSGNTQVRATDPNEFTIDIKGRKRFSLGAGRGASTGPMTGGVRPNFGRLALPPGNLTVGVDYGYLIDPPFFITVSGARLRQQRSAFHIRIGQSF